MNFKKKLLPLFLASSLALSSCSSPQNNESPENTSDQGTPQEASQSVVPSTVTNTPEATGEPTIITTVPENLPVISEELLEYGIHTSDYEYDILAEGAEKYSRQVFALNTIVTLIIYSEDGNGEELLDKAEETIYRYEEALSKTIEGSFTYEINENKEYDLTSHPYKDEILYLLHKSQYYNELSNGYFDITIEPLVNLWGFGEETQGEIPSDSDIEDALSKIDTSNIEINGNLVTLKNDATIDFGGIAKGYIADKVSEVLRENGCQSGIVNLGGNVLTFGLKPTGKSWKVGIKNPDETSDSQDEVTVGAKSVVTSGIYERKFENNGKFYHHILDYTTGYPSESDVLYATIICDSSIDGDALATTIVLLGSKAGIELINSLDNVEAMVYTRDEQSFFSTNFIEEYEFLDK